MAVSISAVLEAVDVRESMASVCAGLAAAWARSFAAPHVGVLVLDAAGERMRHRGSTGAGAQVLDDGQLGLDAGPLMDALRSRHPLTVTNLAGETRWSAWTELAGAWGVTAVTVVPLGPGAGWVGALTLYFTDPPPETPSTTEAVDVTGKLTSTLLDLTSYVHATQRALQTRGDVGLAQGMLMERHDIDEATAMAVLRRLSQHQNIKLTAVARHLVTSARSGSASGANARLNRGPARHAEGTS